MMREEKPKDGQRRDRTASPQKLNEDLRRLELSQFRVLILKYPKDTEKIFKEMQAKTA